VPAFEAITHTEEPMRDATSRSLVRDVLAVGPSADAAAMSRRVEALTTIVLDLLAEVEALRQALAAQPAYRDAYREALLLTHNSAGPSSGWEKLLDRYYPRQASVDGRAWRETLMMRRLGATAADIEAYRREAESAETYT
jgi:hypothetical protein